MDTRTKKAAEKKRKRALKLAEKERKKRDYQVSKKERERVVRFGSDPHSLLLSVDPDLKNWLRTAPFEESSLSTTELLFSYRKCPRCAFLYPHGSEGGPKFAVVDICMNCVGSVQGQLYGEFEPSFL